ncbi:MAG: DUF4097 family beta strand repeat-containing protein [Cyclobacteriaceae bacterium]
MKKQHIILPMILALAVVFTAVGQGTDQHTFTPQGKLIVNGINKISFEGYDGNEVVISTTIKSSSKSERAEGLKLINGSGLEDNTGIGISIVESGGNTEMEELSRRSSRRYVVKVPKSVTVVYEHSTPHGSTVVFSKIRGEIEVKTNHSKVELRDVTGPMTVSTVHGKIEGDFSSLNQDGPISIASSHGLIDISLPADTKANVKLGSGWGEIYSDFDIEFETRSGSLKSYSSNEVRGTLNGGGVDFSAKSSHGNVYLRKK